jgi:ankyrin repeat protein
MLATLLLADFSPETGSAPYVPRTSLDCAESRSFGELHDAVFDGDAHTVRVMIETLPTGKRKAFVNRQTFMGWTPLHLTVIAFSKSARLYKPTQRWEDITKLLLDAGADATLRDKCGGMASSLGSGHEPKALRAEMARLASAGAWPSLDPEDELAGKRCMRGPQYHYGHKAQRAKSLATALLGVL